VGRVSVGLSLWLVLRLLLPSRAFATLASTSTLCGLPACACGLQIRTGAADLIAFGRPTLTNPDLPAVFAAGGSLKHPAPDMKYWYGGGAEGYTEHPYLTPAPAPAAGAGVVGAAVTAASNAKAAAGAAADAVVHVCKECVSTRKAALLGVLAVVVAAAAVVAKNLKRK
jgi:hypothetical protein